MPIPAEAAAWGMKLLLGQEPDDWATITHHSEGYRSVEEMRAAFMRTAEAHALFMDANPALRQEPMDSRPYQIPPFLLRPARLPGVVSRFEPPTLGAPVCQLCTSEQMASPEYVDLCGALGLDASAPQRKFWEFAYILAVLRSRSLVAPGARGLGFGTGQEVMPSALAQQGVLVTASDAPPDLQFSGAWSDTAQWTQTLDDLWKPDLVSREQFFERVSFRPVDMNAIPAELSGFDFCWSACCLEHLGSIRRGLDFIRNSLATLRPGGVAVHTTEFNLMSETATLEESHLCLFRKQDIEQVMHELAAEGHHVEPLNLWPGCEAVDEHVDVPPFSAPHLKLMMGNYVTTSIGLTVTKAS